MMEELYKLPKCNANKLQIDSWVLSETTTLEALKLAVAHGASINHNDANLAYAGGTSITILRWLKEAHRCKFPKEIYVTAIHFGNVEILEYLYANHADIFDAQMVFSESICSNRMEVVKWCFSKGLKITEEFCITFAKQKLSSLPKLTEEMLNLLSIAPKNAMLNVLHSAEFLAHPRLPLTLESTSLIPIHCWKFLTSIGIRPTAVSAVQAVHSPSYLALETTRFLVEELNCPLPNEKQYSPLFMRKDVIAYLSQRGLLKK